MNEQHFLFIGSTTDGDGATTQIKASGGTYRKKLLQSKPENWAVIAEMVQAEDVKGVLVTLMGFDYNSILRAPYQKVAGDLLDALRASTHVVFIHESLFFEPVADVGEIHPQGEADDAHENVSAATDFDDPWDDVEGSWAQRVFTEADSSGHRNGWAWWVGQ